MQTWADLDRWRSGIAAIGMRRLVGFGALAALSSAMIVAGAYFMSRPELETAYTGLSPQETPRMARVLADAGLRFEISGDGTRLMTRRGETPRVRALLAERGLPGTPGSGYELFDKVGPLGLTSFMQEVTRVRALEVEIARTIQMLKGVRAARVHIAMGETGALRRQRATPRASVVVDKDSRAEPTQAEAIRQIVSAAVPGLAAGDVRVVGADGQLLSIVGDDLAAAPGRLVALEKSIAADIQANIARTLTPQLGAENFESTVTVRLNVDKRQTTETTYSPDGRVERSVRTIRETGSAQNAGARNVSVEQNQPQDATTGAADASRRSTQKRDELTNYEIGSRSTATVSEGYRIERIAVAVVLNSKQLSEAGSDAPSAEAQAKRLTEIERLVTAASGADPSRGDSVTVAPVAFVAPALAPGPEPSHWRSLLDGPYPGLLIKVAAFLLATALVVVFGLKPAARAMLQSSPPVALPRPGPGAGASPALGGPPGHAGLLSGEDGAPSEPPAELIQRLVAADPKRAALVLKRWIREDTGS